LSLFNIGGRFVWASLSDHIGRKPTYFVFFALGIVAYLVAAVTGQAQHTAWFVAMFCIILSMYGGGFATIPAYVADLFGTQFVSAIQGRLLTAWSTAGVLGPVLVNYLREFQLQRGVPPAAAYNLTLYISAGLLLLGLLCNLLVRPVADKFFMSAEELDKERQHGLQGVAASVCESAPPTAASWLAVALGWALVGLPLAWGIFKTVEKAAAFFR
jgi:MFS family permease